MDRDEGMDSAQPWRVAPRCAREFRDAILSLCVGGRLEAGALIQTGSEEDVEMSGLASGIMELRSVVGRADTPVMHFARPVFWLSFTRIISQRRSNRIEATAKTTVWLARASQAAVRKLLNERPDWWQYLLQPTLFYGDIALDIAADLLIADSERRCAAVLLRLSARRFADSDDPEPVDLSITQEDLAGAANLSRSSVRTMLGRLAERGLIEQAYGGVTVRAPAALRAFVDEG